MIYKEMEIQVDYEKAGAEHGKYKPMLYGYIMNATEEISISGKRAAVIICPGGAYRFKSDREAEPIAMRFLGAGIQSFVLQYSVAPSRFPCAMLELAKSVSIVREHAKEWGIDEDKIYICGFSAGGHLCASLGTLWKDKILTSVFGDKDCSYRPNGMILSYPVISSGEFAHQESCDLLIGNEPSEELIEKISLDKQVTRDTVPTFIWHTKADEGVPVENTLLFSCALQKNQVPFELHIYENGVHGLALCDETTAGHPQQIVPDNADWINKAICWLKRENHA